jgi:hypothetical protein
MRIGTVSPGLISNVTLVEISRMIDSAKVGFDGYNRRRSKGLRKTSNFHGYVR